MAYEEILTGIVNITNGGTGNTTGKATSIEYTTEAPIAVNTDGLKFVLLDSEPDIKYDGWVYLIKE